MTICDTRIQYNGITLTGVLTEGIEYEPVYDSSGTDIIGIKNTVLCTAYAHISQTISNDPNLPEHGVDVIRATGKSPFPPGLDATLRKLSMPRRHFIMSIGNSVLFNVYPTAVEPYPCSPPTQAAPSNLVVSDIANGPKCSHKVLQVTGINSAKLSLKFEFVTPACENPSLIKDWVSLRYWIADDVDCKTWLTTRTYRGEFRVRGMSVDSHKLARTITLPPIQLGFRRDKIMWAESPDHLTLQFTIVDVEEYAMAPAPATHWSGTFSISLPQGDITAISELRFTLKGDRNTDKADLFELAQSIIDKKLHFQELFPGEQGSPSVLVESQVWEEKLESNEISCLMRLRYLGSKDSTPSFFEHNVTALGPKFELGQPLPWTVSFYEGNPAKRAYHESKSYYPPKGPTAGLAGIFVCALQTACCPQQLKETEINPEIEGDSVEEPISGDPNGTTYMEYSYDENETIRYNEQHRKNPYLWYKMTNYYHLDTGWRGFPLGKQCEYNTTSTDRFAFAQIHCPVCIREVRIEASRINAWPDLPDQRHSWTDGQSGIKYVLKECKIDPCPPQLSADGKHETREVYASFFYYMSRPPESSDQYGFQSGTPAYIKSGTGPRNSILDSAYVPADAFKDPPQILGQTQLTNNNPP